MLTSNIIYIAIGSFSVGIILSVLYLLLRDKWFLSTARREAKNLLDSAKGESERIQKESKIQLKEQMFQTKMELEKEGKEKRKDLQAWEKRLLSKEENLDKKINLMDTKEDKVKRIGDEILEHARFVIGVAAGNNAQMRFKLNRWVYARLMQDEIREKRPVKQALWSSGTRACQKCGRKFKSIKGVEIHRKDSNKIYSVENCQLLCRECHQK